MAWEIIEELIVSGTKYTWTFPSELKNAILSEIESNGNPYFSSEITSQIPNHSMHDWTISDYPFTFHKGSDGDWQGGVSYTIGLGTYNVSSDASSGVYYLFSNNRRAGAGSITNTNGTMVVFFVKNETTHQAAILNVMSAWYLSSDMNRIKLYGYGTSVEDYEQFYSDLVSAIPLDYGSNGGGATHIAKVTGLLSSLSSNLSDILLVSGGGGGGLLVGDTDYSGKEAGGISGSGDNSGDQSTGNAFGLGESGSGVSGGGGGLYGGYKGTNSKSGGAGSGYIGNSLISNKKMVGYNVPTSDTTNTKTESVQVYSAAPFSNKPKMGDGFARIKLILQLFDVNFLDVKKYENISEQIYYSTGSNTDPSTTIVNEHLSEYFLTDNIFVAGKPSNTAWTFNSSENAICKPKDATANANKMWYFPIKRCTNISKIAFDLYLKVEGTMQEWAFCDIGIAKVVGGVLSYTAIPNIGNHGSKTYPYSGQWAHYEYDINVDQMDYLKVGASQSSVKLKNIIITCESVVN